MSQPGSLQFPDVLLGLATAAYCCLTMHKSESAKTRRDAETQTALWMMIPDDDYGYSEYYESTGQILQPAEPEKVQTGIRILWQHGLAEQLKALNKENLLHASLVCKDWRVPVLQELQTAKISLLQESSYRRPSKNFRKRVQSQLGFFATRLPHIRALELVVPERCYDSYTELLAPVLKCAPPDGAEREAVRKLLSNITTLTVSAHDQFDPARLDARALPMLFTSMRGLRTANLQCSSMRVLPRFLGLHLKELRIAFDVTSKNLEDLAMSAPNLEKLILATFDRACMRIEETCTARFDKLSVLHRIEEGGPEKPVKPEKLYIQPSRAGSTFRVFPKVSAHAYVFPFTAGNLEQLRPLHDTIQQRGMDMCVDIHGWTRAASSQMKAESYPCVASLCLHIEESLKSREFDARLHELPWIFPEVQELTVQPSYVAWLCGAQKDKMPTDLARVCWPSLRSVFILECIMFSWSPASMASAAMRFPNNTHVTFCDSFGNSAIST